MTIILKIIVGQKKLNAYQNTKKSINEAFQFTKNYANYLIINNLLVY